MLFLSSCFSLGGQALGEIITSGMRRVRARQTSSTVTNKIICTVLVGYLLSQSGFLNLITSAPPLSYSLDLRRSQSYSLNTMITCYTVCIPESDVIGAVWLAENLPENTVLYADSASRLHLTSYGLIDNTRIQLLENYTIPVSGSFTYVSQFNLLHGIVIAYGGRYFNTSELVNVFSNSNLLYTDGETEVWGAP
jgi:uncharacterized membrane protein